MNKYPTLNPYPDMSGQTRPNLNLNFRVFEFWVGYGVFPKKSFSFFFFKFFFQGEQVEFLKPLEDIETKEKTKVEMNVETSEETSDQVVSWFKVCSISIRFVCLFVCFVIQKHILGKIFNFTYFLCKIP